MKTSDRHTTRKNYVSLSSLFSLAQKNKHFSFSLILSLSTVLLPLSMGLKTLPALAQAEIVPAPSLDKNKNKNKSIIYVNPQTGDDSQSGKRLTPLKTVTQALKIADPGSTIKLTSGTYSKDTGETFPLIIKNQITLKGNADNQGYATVIKGSGYFVSPTGAGQNVAIAALKDAAGITGVTVTNDNSRGHGLWIESSSPQVISNTFTRNGSTGVSVNGDGSPVIAHNYFYNNSGNGLLVYGTSQPKVVDNTFKQTGFGVSIVQNAALTLTGNLFESNRIGIILEGNSQGVLRDNEVINSLESGVTAIAQSRVDLGTTDQPGNNTFRSNKKLDIQNVTNNEIVAVGTQTSGQTEGRINFDQGEFAPINDSSNISNNTPINQPTTAKSPTSPLPQLPSTEKPLANSNIPAPNESISPKPRHTLSPLPPKPAIDTTANASLPAPPPVTETSVGNKELVFNASASSVSDDDQPKPEPVPFPPTFTSSTSSSPAAEVKYKVLVEAMDEEEESEVRSLYPQAFLTVFEGQSLLQVGAFNNRDKAEEAEQNLGNLGLATYLLE